MSRDLRQKAGRLLDQHVDDKHSQHHAPDVPAPADQDGGIEYDGLEGRPCGSIEGAEIGGKKGAAQPAKPCAKDVGLELQTVDISSEGGGRSLVLPQRP